MYIFVETRPIVFFNVIACPKLIRVLIKIICRRHAMYNFFYRLYTELVVFYMLLFYSIKNIYNIEKL